jgi:hypothetical protein
MLRGVASYLSTEVLGQPIRSIFKQESDPLRWNPQIVPKRWNLNYRRRWITHKKAHNFQNKAEVWNQENKI